MPSTLPENRPSTQTTNIIQGDNVSFPSIPSFPQSQPSYSIPNELPSLHTINEVDGNSQLFSALVVNQESNDYLSHRPPQRPSKRARRFNCQFIGCGRAFDSQWALERHIRIHTGEKPFVCSVPECRKSFSDKGALKRHEQTHAPGKPYKCTFPGCGKSFKDKKYLEYHTRLHDEKDAYRCSFEGCERVFTSPKSLKRHEMQQHNPINAKSAIEIELREKLERMERRMQDRVLKIDQQLKKEKEINKELKKQRTELKNKNKRERQKKANKNNRIEVPEMNNPIFVQPIPMQVPLQIMHPQAPNAIAFPHIHTMDGNNAAVDYSVADTISSITL